MTQRPVIIGFDGSDVAEQAVREAGALLAARPTVVVVVWEAGRAFELLEVPSIGPRVTVDVNTATEVDRAAAESARRLAEHGAALAHEVGLAAEGIAVADDATPAATLVRLARERDAAAIVVGSRGRRGITEVLLGSTTRELLRSAPCPVVVARPDKSEA